MLIIFLFLLSVLVCILTYIAGYNFVVAIKDKDWPHASAMFILMMVILVLTFFVFDVCC